MEAILFALGSYVLWAIGDTSGAYAARKVSPYSTFVWALVFGIGVASFFVPFHIDNLKRITLSSGLLTLLIVSFQVVGGLTFYKEMSVGNPSIVGTIGGSFGAVSALLAILFLGETLIPFQLIALFFIFVGVVLCGIDLKDIRKNPLEDKGFIWAVLTMIFWGIFGAFIKIPIETIGWFFANYFSILTLPFIFVYFKLNNIRIDSFKTLVKKKVLYFIFGAALCIRIGELAYNNGIDQRFASVVAPIASSYTTLFVVLAFLVFKEPVSKQQIFGILLTLLGIVLLSFLSA